MKPNFLIAALLLTNLHAADIELTETLQLPECHSIGWVRANTQVKGQKNWDGVLDEAKWGTPSPSRRWSEAGTGGSPTSSGSRP